MLRKYITVFNNWQVPLFVWFGIFKIKYILFYLRNGYVMLGEKWDVAPIVENFYDKDYELGNFVELQEGDTVVDIGANIGSFSLYAMKKAGKIFAYEPAPVSFWLLETNVKMNNALNIKLFRKAVTREEGSITLGISKEGSSGNSSYIKSETNVVVPATNLKAIMEENGIKKIDFLKVDCEGAEYDIILTTPPAIYKKIKKIALEYHKITEEHRPEELIEVLLKNGFEVRKIEKNDSVGILYGRKI